MVAGKIWSGNGYQRENQTNIGWAGNRLTDSGSCTVIFNCSNASGAWGTGDSASLTVDTTVSIHGEDRPGEQVAVITLAGGGLDATQMDAIKAGLRLRLSAIAVVHEVRFALTA